MKKENNIYSIAKDRLAKYISELEDIYQFHLHEIQESENNAFLTDDEQAEIAVSIQYCRTWEAIMSLSPNDRNLFLLHQIMNRKPQKTLQIFNGIGGDLKNVSTLSSMITIIKRKIKERLL